MSGWVSFDDEGNPPAAVTSKDSGRSPGQSKKGSPSWVKFEVEGSGAGVPVTSTPTSLPAHPELQRSVVAQNTGGSGHSGADVMSQESDDRHSAVASSIISSRGSLSGSHDNISSSREYMPLESSSPKPGNITSEGWITFGDSKAITSSTPSKPLLVKSTVQNGTPERARVASPIPTNWVQFDDAKNEVNSSLASSRTSSRPSPVSSPSNNSPSTEPLSDSNPLNGRNSVERIEQQSQGISAGHIKVDSRHVEDTVPSAISHSRATPLHMTDHANDMEVSILSANASIADAKLEPASPGNPFKEEVLNLKQLEKQKIMDDQVQRTVSPFNPFLNTGKMATDNTSVKIETSKQWTTFDESEEVSSRQISAPSPGNPFANMTTTANVHNRLNLSQPYDPHQQVNVNPSMAVQQNILSSQPARQVVAVQPLSQSTATAPASEQRTAAALSPNMYGSQNATPFSTKPNQWQPQQQFFPPSPQKNYSQAAAVVAAKQPIAAIVAPTTSAASGDMPDSGKPELRTQTSVKSNISSPGGGKMVEFKDSFPREQVDLAEGWSLKLRRPDKKKLAGSRYWQPVHVRLSEGNILQLFNDGNSRDPFRELPLQCNYDLGGLNLQHFDVRGKIHTIKLFYVSYKEKRSLSAKSFYEKAPYQEELIKLGTLDYKVFMSFVYTVNDALMRLTLFQDRGAHYHQDLISVTVKDDFRCLIDPNGEIAKQSIIVGVTVLSFLSGSPDCAIGLNDVRVKGLDIVDRQHIIPNKTSDWIQLHNVDLHKCANKNVFVDSRMIEFQPLNACRFRLMQFQVEPPKEDLPLQVRACMSGEGTHVEMRVDLLIPACTGKRMPAHFLCENVAVRIPVPENWISYFRVPKRMGQSSIHAAIKRADLIKRGCLKPRLLEISVGSAKYEHAHRAIVWRIEKLPERISGQPLTHILKCHLNLTSAREVAGTLTRLVEVEYRTAHTTASKTTVRSLAISSEKSPEKRIRYCASYQYEVQIEQLYTRIPEREGAEPNACIQQ